MIYIYVCIYINYWYYYSRIVVSDIYSGSIIVCELLMFTVFVMYMLAYGLLYGSINKYVTGIMYYVW